MWKCVCVYDYIRSVCKLCLLCVCDSISVCIYGGLCERLCKWVRLILSVCLCDCEHLLMSGVYSCVRECDCGFLEWICVCVCVCVWMCRRGDIVQSLKLKCWNKVLISWDHLRLPFRISANSTNDSEILRCYNTLYFHQRACLLAPEETLISWEFQVILQKCQGS